MSNKNRKSVAEQLAPIAAKFWQHVEQKCRLDGVPILERPYYGLRPEDRIQLPVGDQLVAGTISEFWRKYCQNLGINADLFMASQTAVVAGLLKSSVRRGEDKKNPGKQRSYGVQFWTPGNTLYLAKKSATPDSNAVTPAALIDALIGSAPVVDQTE